MSCYIKKKVFILLSFLKKSPVTFNCKKLQYACTNLLDRLSINVECIFTWKPKWISSRFLIEIFASEIHQEIVASQMPDVEDFL